MAEEAKKKTSPGEFIRQAGVAPYGNAPLVHRIGHLPHFFRRQRPRQVEARTFCAEAGQKRFNGQGHYLLPDKVNHALPSGRFRGYTRKQWGLDPSERSALRLVSTFIRTSKPDRANLCKVPA